MSRISYPPLLLMLALPLALATNVFSQTQPAAQSIPYATDLGSLSHASTTYPAGWRGWAVSASPSGSFATGSPIGDQALIASSSASNATLGVHNYNGKLGLLSGTGVNPGLVLAVNTTGAVDVEVQYTVGTLRDPFNGTTNTRIGSITLQYRVGASGAFTTLSGVNYQNNQTTQIGAGVTTPLNPALRSITLPSACNDKPLVQLRWVLRDVSGVGARPSFFMDDIDISPGALCTENVTIELRTDVNSQEASWEIVSPESNVVLCNAGGFPSNITSPIASNCCLPDGCYRLVVFDAAGDGFGTEGGYQLRLGGPNTADIRIIDNLGNFSSGFESSIGNGPSTFCIPMSTLKPIFSSREKLDWVNGQYFVAEPDGDVSAVWIPNGADNVQSTTTGYEFWLFDPNGTYSYRRFRNHATSDGFGNVGASRACHMKINNWFASQAAPANRLLNVRIRTRVNNVNGLWGPAYRFKIDPVRAACPLTLLNDFPGNQFESCNKTRTWGGSNLIHARPVSGANRYQWRFRTVGEPLAPIIIRTTTNYFLTLNWTVNPLIPGKTYTVDVRASKTAGATWCTDAVAPALVDEWGTICNLTIAGSQAQGGGQNLALDSDNTSLSLYPNPNRGDQVWLSIDRVDEGVETISVDFFDLAGHRAVARTIPAQGTNLNSLLELDGLAAGVYIVHIRAGEKVYTERLVIAQ
jgi:hypothetical protein